MLQQMMIFFGATFLAVSTGQAAETPPPSNPPGAAKTPKTRALETGAKLLQTDDPLDQFDMYMDGFHAAKKDPAHQMEAHHFCKQVNQDFAQCVLFDGNTKSANLIGIEYIISEKLFNTLPAQERTYWHPHNYEILSGQLIAPRIPKVAEKSLMKDKINSYGKTWHVWNSAPFGKRGDALPLGEPMLEWSFNRDGEAYPAMVEARDKRMGVSTKDERENRADLTRLAKPQAGVDDMKSNFPGATAPIPGVVDQSGSQNKPLPTKAP